MFTHAWHWITAATTRWSAPYWFCAKCGEHSWHERPEAGGCEIEK